MAEKKEDNVSMRVRIGECELEVTGPKAFVETKIDEFVVKQRSHISSTKDSVSEATDIQSKQTTGGSHKRTSISQFFRKTAPKTDVDRALFAGYFLESYKNQESFTSNEIRDAIRQAKVSPPKNTSDAIAKNIKKGLMMAAGDKDGKMAFVLTSDGEDVASGTSN